MQDCDSTRVVDGKVFVCIVDHKRKTDTFVLNGVVYQRTHNWRNKPMHWYVAAERAPYITDWSHKVMTVSNLFFILGIACLATAVVGSITLGR